jgi:hypothetical protein
MRSMVPTAILAGMVLGYFIRWWAIPVVGVAWSVLLAVSGVATDWLEDLLVGALNSLVGVLVAVLLRRLVRAASLDHASVRRHR